MSLEQVGAGRSPPEVRLKSAFYQRLLVFLYFFLLIFKNVCEQTEAQDSTADLDQSMLDASLWSKSMSDISGNILPPPLTQVQILHLKKPDYQRCVWRPRRLCLCRATGRWAGAAASLAVNRNANSSTIKAYFPRHQQPSYPVICCFS